MAGQVASRLLPVVPRWDQDLTKWKQFMSGSRVTHEWLMSGQWMWVMIGSWIACLSNMHIFKSTARGTRNQVGIEFAQPSWVCNKNSSWVSAVSLFMSGQWKKHSERRSGEKMFMSGCSFVKNFHEQPKGFFSFMSGSCPGVSGHCSCLATILKLKKPSSNVAQAWNNVSVEINGCY